MSNKRKRLPITNEEWNIIETMADNAKHYWFYDETFFNKTLSIENIECVYTGFLKQNFRNLSKFEVLYAYEYFVKAGVIDDYGRNQLIEYLMEKECHID